MCMKKIKKVYTFLDFFHALPLIISVQIFFGLILKMFKTIDIYLFRNKISNKLPMPYFVQLHFFRNKSATGIKVSLIIY